MLATRDSKDRLELKPVLRTPSSESGIDIGGYASGSFTATLFSSLFPTKIASPPSNRSPRITRVAATLC